MSPPIAGARGSTAFRDWTFLIAFSFFRIAAIVPGRLQALARRQRLEPGARPASGRVRAVRWRDIALEEVEAACLRPGSPLRPFRRKARRRLAGAGARHAKRPRRPRDASV